MTETRRLSAEIGGKVGIGEDVIVSLILALLQSLPALLAVCSPPPTTTPAETLKWAAANHPFAVRLAIRKECRSDKRRESIRQDSIPAVQHEVLHAIHAESVERLAAVCAEAKGMAA